VPHKDETLLLADVGRKARQVEVLVTQLLERHSPPDRAKVVAHLLAGGVWTHDHPLMAPTLKQFGFPVKIGVSPEERSLMNLYPQPRGRQESVETFPDRLVPGLSPGRETPRRRRELPAAHR
jgi:hypothetical protein